MNNTYGSYFLMASLLVSGKTIGQKTKEVERPNIVFIMADDISHNALAVYGADKWTYGPNVKTPNLDKLANEGMRFNHAYSCPLSTPTRVALMTGKNNGRNHIGVYYLEESQVSFGNLFQHAGYKTLLAGKWKLSGKTKTSFPDLFGYDEYFVTEHEGANPPRYYNPVIGMHKPLDGIVRKNITYTKGEYGPDLVNNYVLDFIERNKNQPFLVYYPMVLVHDPHTPTPDMPNYNENKENNSNFPNMIEYMDKHVGSLVAKLKELGLSENTIIIFTGDNGTKVAHTVYLKNGSAYGGGKGLLSDEGVHVPMIVNRPGIVPVGTNNDLVCLTDIYPTLCEIAGITIPSTVKLDGQSFYTQALGQVNSKPREAIYHWFSNNPDVDVIQESAFNQQFRLYKTGKFYDVQKDFKEKTALNVSALTVDQKKAYDMLNNVLNQNKKVVATGVSITNSEISLLEGTNYQLNATVLPSNATQNSLRWSSSDATVVKVTKWGLLTAVKAGNAIVKVKSFDNLYTSEVKVSVGSHTNIELIQAEKNKNKLQVFTNPIVDRKIKLKISDMKEPYLRILNAQGQCVYRKKTNSGNVEISNANFLTSGIYLLNIYNANESYSNKIIIR